MYREQPWPSGSGCWACHEVQGSNPEKVIGGVRCKEGYPILKCFCATLENPVVLLAL